jgi:hypothetical protein
MSLAKIVQAHTQRRVAVTLRDVILTCVIYCLRRVKGKTTLTEPWSGGGGGRGGMKEKKLSLTKPFFFCPSTEVIT